jgi:hypothetical protein
MNLGGVGQSISSLSMIDLFSRITKLSQDNRNHPKWRSEIRTCSSNVPITSLSLWNSRGIDRFAAMSRLTSCGQFYSRPDGQPSVSQPLVVFLVPENMCAMSVNKSQLWRPTEHLQRKFDLKLHPLLDLPRFQPIPMDFRIKTLYFKVYSPLLRMTEESGFFSMSQ